MRIRWALVMVLVAAATTWVTTTGTATGQGTVKPPLYVSRIQVIKGESLTFTGTIGTRSGRPLKLMWAPSCCWLTLARSQTRTSGRFSITITVPAGNDAYGFHVVAPRTSTLPAVTTRDKYVSIVRQTATLRLQGTTATGTFDPARPGRAVTLQRQDPAGWTVVASGAENASGVASFALPAGQTAPAVYRVVAAALNGAAAVASWSAAIDLPPAQPTNLTATPIGRGFDLSWTVDPAPDVDTVYYRISAVSSTGPWTRPDIDSQAAHLSSGRIVRLDPLTHYWVAVRVYDSEGNGSPWSAPAEGTTLVRNGHFLAVYAVASDETPNADHPAAIRDTLDAVNGWYATQTSGGVQPRFARDGQGQLDVRTVTLTATEAELASDNFSSVVGLIRDAVGSADDEKLVVFVDVPLGDTACGKSEQFLDGSGVSIIFETNCVTASAGVTWPYGATYVTAHEMAHNLGAVASCAPHSTGDGHINDDPRDLLYSGPMSRDWAHLMLDPGHDDYYLTGSTTCADIATSDWWTASADPLS